MTNLSDIQSVLLAGAAARDNGSLLPPATSIAEAGERLSKALAALLKRGLIEERVSADADSIWKVHDDERIGLFITNAGRIAIGDTPTNTIAAAATEVLTPAAPKSERGAKSAAVVALLERDGGATPAELIAATGWLPHTTRAALTGLKRKGHVIEKTKRDNVTCYRIKKA